MIHLRNFQNIFHSFANHDNQITTNLDKKGKNVEPATDIRILIPCENRICEVIYPQKLFQFKTGEEIGLRGENIWGKIACKIFVSFARLKNITLVALEKNQDQRSF